MQYDLVEEILTGELTDRQYFQYLTSSLYSAITEVLSLPEKQRAELQRARETRFSPETKSEAVPGIGANV
jgi:hypothetical protein